MTVTVSGPKDFTLSALQRVALHAEGFEFSRRALRQIDAWHREFSRYVAENSQRFIYGVTSGYGPKASTRIAPEKNLHHEMPFIGFSFSDEHFPDSHVRAMFFSMAAMVINGAPALSSRQASAVTRALKGPMPSIPSSGITSPGEMMVLFYLLRVLPELTSELACSHCNGAVGSVAIAGLRALAARRRIQLAEQIFALSADAIQCPMEHFHPGLKPLWGDRYEGESLDSLGYWLRGAKRTGRRSYQAPVSYRILPRVLGQARRAVHALERAAEQSLQGLTTNPTYVASSHGVGQKTLSNAGFHETPSPQALDNVMATWTDLASIAHRHANKLHRGAVSKLPDRLRRDEGPSTTYIEYVAGDIEDEMRRLAQPSLLSPADPGASDQDDVNSPGLIACRMEARVAHLFDRVLTLTAVTASQALSVTDRRPPKNLARLVSTIRRHFPVVESVRDLGVDAQALSSVFTQHCETGEVLK